MANIRGIELASEIYDLEDTSARNTATAASQTATQAGQTAAQASQTASAASQTASAASQTAEEADEKIGNLANLETTAKTNLVAAINEVNGTLEETTLTFEGGATVLKRKGNLLFIDSSLDTEIEPSFPAVVGENIPERFRPTQNLRLTVYNNTTDQPIGQFVYNKNANRFYMYVTPSLVPQNGEVVVATGITPLW